MATARRFPIRFTGVNRAMVVLGILRRWSYVEVDEVAVRVRLSWAFTSTFDRGSVRAAAPYRGRVLGWGAHGWRGRWLVNGSSSGIVEVELDPEGRARVTGVPVRLRTLLVAVDDPDGLIAELSGPA